MPPPTEGFAIASFVLGLLGFVPLGVVFGVLALGRIRRAAGGLGGRGLAMAGIILSAFWFVVFVAIAAFGYFGIQALWTDNEVSEAEPVFDSEQGSEPAATDTDAAPSPSAPPEPTIVTEAEGSFVGLGRYSTAGRAAVLGDGSGQRFLRLTEFATDNGPDLNVYLTTTPADGDPSTFDDDFVDLGDLRGNLGDQNYEIPADLDLDRYSTVVVWCVRFTSAFGAAQLA